MSSTLLSMHPHGTHETQWKITSSFTWSTCITKTTTVSPGWPISSSSGTGVFLNAPAWSNLRDSFYPPSCDFKLDSGCSLCHHLTFIHAFLCGFCPGFVTAVASHLHWDFSWVIWDLYSHTFPHEFSAAPSLESPSKPCFWFTNISSVAQSLCRWQIDVWSTLAWSPTLREKNAFFFFWNSATQCLKNKSDNKSWCVLSCWTILKFLKTVF